MGHRVEGGDYAALATDHEDVGQSGAFLHDRRDAVAQLVWSVQARQQHQDWVFHSVPYVICDVIRNLAPGPGVQTSLDEQPVLEFFGWKPQVVLSLKLSSHRK